MSKSMIYGNNIKQPGSFSHKYVANNLSSSHITNKKDVPSNEIHYEIQEPVPLQKSNLNKSNILMGILNQKKTLNKEKSRNKNKYLSGSYASNYLSPYSTKRMK